MMCFLAVTAAMSTAPTFLIQYAGLITTLGTGTLGTNPSGIAIDLNGNVYVSDTSNNAIVKVNASGTATILMISGLTLNTLNAPAGVVTDSAGDLFVADSGHNRVVKVTPAGACSVISTSPYVLTSPQGVAVDVSGNIYVSDTGNNRIIEMSSGTASVVSTSSGISLATLSAPKGIAVDAFGNLFIADFGNSRVVKVTTGGAGSTLTGNPALALSGPTGVFVGRNGVIYIVDKTANRVMILDPAGVDRDLVAITSYSTTFIAPTTVAVSPMGTIYVEDSGGAGSSGRVQTIQANTTNFGHVTLGASTHIQLPFSVGALDTLTSRRVYTAGTQNLDFTIAGDSTCIIGTAGNGSVSTPCNLDVVFTPTAPGLRKGAVVLTTSGGNITLPIFGYADAPVAALSPGVASPIKNGSSTVPVQGPFHTAVDGAGNMYVAGYNSGVVTKIPAGGGTPTTVSTAPFVLGSPGPTGIAVDAANNLFIADYSNNRIIEVDSGGTASILSISGLPATTVGGVTDILHAPTALGFDQVGNLYITDYGSGRIIEVTPSLLHSDGQAGFAYGTIAGGNGYAIGTVGVNFGFTTVTGSTVDPSGNVFVANRGASPPTILKVDPLGTISTVGLGSVGTLSSPFDMTSDPWGNLYIMDSGNIRVVQVLTNGNASIMKFSGSSLNINIFGLTVDGNGNVLVSDFQNNRLVNISTGQSAVTFPNTNVGSTSSNASPASATVTNLGNQSLIFSSNPTYTANFSQLLSDPSPCTSSTTLTTGSSCNVPILFSPQSAGSLSANVTVTDNNLNVAASTQQIAASGIGVATLTSTAVAFSPTSSVYGQSLTITATVSAAGATPTGTVTITDQTTSTTLASNLTLISGVATYSLSTLAPGSHSIKAVYTPTSSFASSTGSATVTIAQDSTTTVLGLSGSTLTATVTANAPGSGTPTGSVQFFNGSTSLGSTALSGGTAALTVTLPPTYSFTAVYEGDTNFTTSTSSAITRTASPTTTAVAFSPTSSTYGQSLTITATVSATGATPTGTVTFTDQTTSTTLASSVSLSSGVASFTLNTLGAGTHSIQAVYSPSGAFLTSNGSNMVAVGQDSTTTVLGLSGSTLTATVTANAPGAGTPTGSVQFFNGGTSLGSTALSGGTAALTVTLPPTYSFTAVYAGDTNFTTSTSPAVTKTSIATTTVVAFSPTSSTYGQSLTIAATVSATGTTPTGTVTFTDQTTSTTLASNVSLSSGVASFTLNTLGAGTHLIQAVYSPSGTFLTSNGSNTVVVAKAGTSTALGLSGGTLTASVTVNAPGSGTPTGSVQFFNGSTSLGTTTLSGATAALTVTVPPSYSFTAVYSGDTNFTASTSPAKAAAAPPADQAITFQPIPGHVFGDAPFPVFATASSGLPVTYSILSGPATISGNVVTLTGIGSVNVQASQAGNASYNPATAIWGFPVFAPQVALSLAANPAAGGTVTANPGATYSAGQKVQVAAQANPGYVFVGFSGALSGLSNPQSLQLDQSSAVTANFAPLSTDPNDQFTFAVTGGGSSNGNLQKSPLVAGASVLMIPSTGGSWLNAVADSGTPPAVTLSLNNTVASQLPAGTYTSYVLLTSATGQQRVLTVTLLVDIVRITKVLDGAGYRSQPLASAEQVTVFGYNLASSAVTPPGLPLGPTLGSTSVIVTDGAGVARAAQLVYVSNTQVNLITPDGMAPGSGSLTVANAAGSKATFPVRIAAPAPGLFTAAQNGKGVAAALVIRVSASGTVTISPSANCDSTGACTPVAIDVSNPADQVFVSFYGTGIRGVSGLSGVAATIGGVPVEVQFAGAQSLYPGLDQVNVKLNPSLAGQGDATVAISFDGNAANPVSIRIR
jgi:DNA-binding beta-propeller fold protein YncE